MAETAFLEAFGEYGIGPWIATGCALATHAAASNLGIRIGLWVAVVNVNLNRPRARHRLSCRGVRPSIAEPLTLARTWGVTHFCLRSVTNSKVS